MFKKIGIFSAVIAALLVTTLSVPVLATRSETDGGGTEVAPTFSQDISTDRDIVELRFGQSLLFAGGNITTDKTTPGLLLAIGSGLTLSSKSDYAFIAGNEINFSAQTARDVFIAGNIVNILPEAQVGRDVFVAAYHVVLESDLAGSLSATGSQVVLKDVKIAGNVNLSVESVSFEGDVEIAGTLVYNDDATVAGLEHVRATAVETYTPEVHTQTAADFWLSEIKGIVSLFVAAIIIFAIWSRARTEVTSDNSLSKIAGNLAYGFIFLLAVPIAVILLLLSYVAAPLGLIVILAYILMIYLSQAFTGAWIGHLILAKGLKVKFPVFVEALVGIMILSCLSLFPGLNFIVGFLAIIFGLGMMIHCLKPSKAEAAKSNERKGTKGPQVDNAKKLPKKVKSSTVKTKASAKVKTSAKAAASGKNAKATKKK